MDADAARTQAESLAPGSWNSGTARRRLERAGAREGRRSPPRRAASGRPTAATWRAPSTRRSPRFRRDNFSSLKIAWRAKSPDAFLSLTLPNGDEWAADSKLIFEELKRLDPEAMARQRVAAAQQLQGHAADGQRASCTSTRRPRWARPSTRRTGATQWVYNPRSYEAGTTTMSARWNQRGVAYWTDGKEERIFWGTGDGYLIGVDAKTGRPIRPSARTAASI